MNHISGKIFFNSENKKTQEYPSLNNNIDCDVLIIGGGVTGALCSYFFRKNNINCVTVEKDLVAQSSTSVSTSLLEYQVDVTLHTLKNLIGDDNAITCFKLGEKAVSTLDNIINTLNLDCDFEKVPCILYSNSEDDIPKFKTEFKERLDAGFNIKYIDNDTDMKLPSDIICGLLTEDASAVFNPYKFTVELFNNLTNNGLQLFEHTMVISTEHKDNKVICKTSTGNTITANKVLICTGYSGASMVAEKIASFTRTFNIVTSPIKAEDCLWHKNSIIINNDDPYTYFRTTADNRIIIGGCDIEDLDEDVNKFENAYNTLLGKLRNIFPDFDNYTIDYKFNGLFADSKQSLPYICEDANYPNHYFCLSYGSNGIVYSTFGAEMLANLHMGNVDSNLHIFKFNRK